MASRCRACIGTSSLKEPQTISGFRYLPRAEEGYPGMIKGYKAYVKGEAFKM